MEIPDQQETWNKIAGKWKDYRQRVSPTVVGFLKDKKGKLLDLGCGSGRNFIKKGGLSCYGVDFSSEMLKFAEDKKIAEELKVSSAGKIPYEDDFFDAGICVALLHCVYSKNERKKILKEFYRVLKPGKEGLVSVWSRKSPRLKNKEKECFVPWTVNEKQGKEKRYTYIYDKEELEKELEWVGFEILRSWEERNVNVIVRK